MASFAMMAISSAISAFAFGGVNYLVSKLDDRGSEERKRANRAREKLEKANMKWSRDRQKKLDFYNRYLREEIKLLLTSAISTKQQHYIIN